MHSEKIKVLQIIGDAHLGGVVACLLNYYRHIDKSKFSFDFVTYGPSPFDETVRQICPEAKIFYIAPFHKNPIKGMVQLAKICKSDKYDIAHSHLTTLSAFALASAAIARIPVRICHSHSIFDRRSDHYIIKSILRPFASVFATHLMACSRHAAENLFRKNAGKAFILMNAIEIDRFSSSEEEYKLARQKLALHGKIVIFVGRFVYQKNLPFLIKAFATARKNEDMTLILLGNGNYKPTIRNTIKKYGISESVKFISPRDPAIWYKAADIFCLPSLYEGLGIAAIEAQAAGLKCLLSTAVPKETDATNQCVFLPDEYSAWAAELNRPAKHHYDSKDALIAARYDILKEAENLTNFYEFAINDREKQVNKNRLKHHKKDDNLSKL